MVIAQKESSHCLRFGRKQDLKGGERETDLPVHAHCITSHSSLIFSLFFSVFFLIFFFSSCSVFSFYSPKYALFSDPSYRARQEPFYSACCDQGFTILPLNRLCLVWAYLPTTRGVCHSLLPDRGRFHFSLYCSTSFLPRCKCSLSPLSRHAPNGFPSNLPLLGGLSSQKDVPPKRGLGRSRK